MPQRFYLLHLALADKGRRIGLVPLLVKRADHDGAGGARKARELLQRLLHRPLIGIATELHADQYGALRPALCTDAVLFEFKQMPYLCIRVRAHIVPQELRPLSGLSVGHAQTQTS